MPRVKSECHMKRESPTVAAISALLSLGIILIAGCSAPEAGNGADVTVFEGARLIVGDGSAAIEDAGLGSPIRRQRLSTVCIPRPSS